MSKLKKLRAAILAALEQEFGNVTTDRGILSWDGEEDLKAGEAVYVEDAEGNRVTASDGDYTTEDGKVIVVVDGKVSEIRDKEAEVESEFVQTDKGKLEWDDESRDLQAGDAVYITDEEGNRNPAPDGDYKTEDGKIIRVADGKVTEIVDDKAEVSEEGEKAQKMSCFARIKQAFEESFDEKMRQISEAIAKVREGDFYLVESGEDYGVVATWNEEDYTDKYFRYAIKWNEDGSAEASGETEVKMMFVPMDFESPFTKEEMAALKAENASLKKEVEKLKKQPAAKPAHQEVVTAGKQEKTGIKGLDRLSRLVDAGK